MALTAASPDFPCASCPVRDEAICAALSDDELRRLSAIATAVELEAGRAAFYEGDKDTFLFNIVSGALRLSKLLPDGRRQIVGFLFSGDFLGLSVAGVYAYTAEALTRSSLCRFDRRRLTEIAERFPELERRLLGLASNELVQAQEHLLILGQKKAAERVATILTKLATRIGRQTNGGSLLDLPMTREDLADYTGLTIETVSRQISRLRENGIIETPSARTIRIRDKSALLSLSGDV